MATGLPAGSPSPAEMVRQLADIVPVRRSFIAAVCGVSERSVSAWLAGRPIRKRHREALESLYRVHFPTT